MDEPILQTIKDYGSTIAAVGAATTVIVTAVKYGIPAAQRAWNTHCLLRSLYDTFGPEGANVLKAAMVEIQSRHTRLSAKLDVITRNMSIGLYVCSPDGRCSWCTQYLADLFQLPMEEMMGYGWLKHVVEPQNVYQHWRWSVDNRTPYRHEYEITNATKHKIYRIYTEAYPVMTEDRASILFYMGFIKVIEERERQGPAIDNDTTRFGAVPKSAP